MGFDHRLSLFVLAFIDQVKILFEVGADAGLGGGLLARFVEQTLGCEGRNVLAFLVDVQDRPLAGVVRAIVLSKGAADEFVVSDRHLVAVAHLHFFFLIQGRAGKSNHCGHYAEVNDISAIAARVAVGQLHHGGEHALAGVLRDDASTAIELRGHGQRDQHRERDHH